MVDDWERLDINVYFDDICFVDDDWVGIVQDRMFVKIVFVE
jgi:hypothetical protein